jgi:integrase
MRRDRRLGLAEVADAREALGLLEGSNLTLAECVRIALRIEGSGEYRRVTLERAIDDFLTDCRGRVKRGALRARTVDFYSDHLWAFEEGFSGKDLDGLQRRELQQYFDQGAGAAKYRSIRALFNWALRQDPQLLRTNPLTGVRLPSVVREEEVAFLSVEEAAALLAADPPYRWVFALCLFAGIRPEEIASSEKRGLHWEHINRAEKLIRIPADIAKGSRRGSMARLIDQAPDNLWTWLTDAPAEGPVFPHLPRQITYWARKLAGYTGARKWPYDGLRRSFATYHTACFNDVGKTSLIMGHRGDPSMLHRHYRGLATRAQGEAYFALRGD